MTDPSDSAVARMTAQKVVIHAALALLASEMYLDYVQDSPTANDDAEVEWKAERLDTAVRAYAAMITPTATPRHAAQHAYDQHLRLLHAQAANQESQP